MQATRQHDIGTPTPPVAGALKESIVDRSPTAEPASLTLWSLHALHLGQDPGSMHSDARSCGQPPFDYGRRISTARPTLSNPEQLATSHITTRYP